jgi:hypothetical protein
MTNDPQFGERLPAPEPARQKPFPWRGLLTFVLLTFPFTIPLCVWLTRLALGL